MRPPCETVVNSYLTALRVALANILNEKGYSQTKISNLLGVSQPAISGYLKSNAYDFWLFSKEALDQLTSQIIAQIEENSPKEEVIKSICIFCKEQRIHGPMCKAHKQELSFLPENCEACVSNEKSTEDRYSLLSELDITAKEMIEHPLFYRLIPEVQLNIASCMKEAKTPEEVAAFPGRIIKVSKKAQIISNAQFGASEHTAKILLKVKSLNSSITTALTLAYKAQTLLFLEKISIMKAYEGKPFSYENEKLVLSADAPFLIVDLGAEGIEPIIYLFTTSIQETKKVITLLLEKYKEQIS
ncbi:MAG: thiamine-phosphate synthase family protein [Candidatus Kariarchaeaceae archaeon]